MLKLAAENGGKPDDPNKRDPLDFVLWQPSAPDEPAWQSRWGPGRPGWHIECSALAMRELGNTVDLHGGGRDLIFPHHECEVAQSESVTGTTFSRHWLHVGMVGLEGKKMSKSLGNLVFVGDLLKDWEPMVLRLALLAHHYRSDWEWEQRDLAVAAERLEAWRSASSQGLSASPMLLEEVGRHLDSDLDTPEALVVIDENAARGLDVAEAATQLGVEL